MKPKYLQAFMDMTERFAQTSEATRLKVGACIIKNGNPIAFGVNGTLPGWESNTCESQSGETLPDIVLHAEINALNKLRKISESSKDATLLVTHSPCLRCAHEIVDSGIKHVYYKHQYRSSDGIEHLLKHGIDVIQLATHLEN